MAKPVKFSATPRSYALSARGQSIMDEIKARKAAKASSGKKKGSKGSGGGGGS